MHEEETSCVGRNVLEFFCVPLCTNYLSNFHKEFQVTFTYDTNAEYQIWSFCYNVLWSYADNRLSHTHTRRERERERNLPR